ncbi:hypothetical protein ITJ57_19170 [Plantibacter sp. VKM Ac-2880]|uniref:hypothetical protein n=1 Tax=Plantibacter sp. VKM Ac-2880 TaxID=2783827 RepID=UPI00188F9E0A|nr:hypothetical protein [Plantibacter sp. VKM Ac-2880]MBF4570894.1 hypothetical protein [Plantibacter sp. VKM Ac-2880]
MTHSPALLRTFLAHVAATAEIASPPMHSGLHEDVVDFLAVTTWCADLESPLERFEPTPSNQWLSAGLAAAVAYRSTPEGSSMAHPFVLAVFAEGDVTRYRFARFEDATHAGRLWSIGLI